MLFLLQHITVTDAERRRSADNLVLSVQQPRSSLLGLFRHQPRGGARSVGGNYHFISCTFWFQTGFVSTFSGGDSG